jgi:hypothetical protein
VHEKQQSHNENEKPEATHTILAKLIFPHFLIYFEMAGEEVDGNVDKNIIIT